MSREVVVLCGCGQRNRLRRFHTGPIVYQCLDCGAPIAHVEHLDGAAAGKYILTAVKWTISLVALAGLLHVLTQPAGAPGLPIGTVAARANTAHVAPDSGVLRRRMDTAAALSFEADADASYVVRLVDVATLREEMLLFVAAGESVETIVRPGHYRLTTATGGQWLNDDELFGVDTVFYRLAPRGAPDGALALDRGESRVVRLKSSPASALQRLRIDREEF